MSDSDIDAILGPVAKELPHCADLILDIRAAARERRHPGRCVRCFFELSTAAPRAGALEILKSWLERNIAVEARGGAICERLPLVLEGTDLEGFCRELMDRVYWDRPADGGRVELAFAYC